MTNSVAIEDQIACVRRELQDRMSYPRCVGYGKIEQLRHERELECMRAVLETLESLPKDRPELFA